ncbi:glutamate--tRNA ligase, partial [Clostridium perfringens]
LNNHYIKNADPERVAALAIPHLQAASRLPAELTPEQETWAKALVALYQEQMTAASNIVELSDLFFRTHLEMDAEAAAVLAEPQVPEVMNAFLGKVEASSAAEFKPEQIAAWSKEVQKEPGAKGKGLFMP